MMPPAQDGSALTRDILASFPFIGGKWRRVVHHYVQSMVQTDLKTSNLPSCLELIVDANLNPSTGWRALK